MQQPISRANYPANNVHNPVRLSIVTQFYPPDYAATGQLIEELADRLSHQGMEVKVFTGQPGYAFQKESAPSREQPGHQLLVRRSRASRVWSRRIRGRTFNGLLFCLRAALHLLKVPNQGDVLLVTSEPPYLPVLGYLTNLCFGLPYVCLIYDIYPDIAVELKVVAAEHWLTKGWNFINKLVWQRAQAIVVLSSTMQDRIAAKCPEVSNKISVIHSWANPNWIIPIAKQDNWFAHQYNLVNKFTVLYSGNMGRCHDMDTILDAAAQLKDEAIEFVFIGAGAKRQACIDKAKSLGLKNCQFLPYQEKQFLPYSLTACDLSLVSLSPNMEGLIAPSKLYGILAAGRPVGVVCEKHSYLRQLLTEANCGAAFENSNATGLANFIRRLAKDPQQSEKMGKAGRHYLQSNFTLEIIATHYARVLSKVADRSAQMPLGPERNSKVDTIST